MVRHLRRAVLALIAAAAFSLGLAAAPGAALAQTPNICGLLPGGYTAEPWVTDPLTSRHGITACIAKYGSGLSAIQIDLYASHDEAGLTIDHQIQRLGRSEGSGWGDRSAVGSGRLLASAEMGDITFRINCYVVQGTWNAESAGQIQALLRQIENDLRPRTCGNGNTPPANPDAGAPQLGLACDPNYMQSEGQLRCTANLTTISGGAAYRWVLDGETRSESGPDLVADGLPQGDHRVDVSAVDNATGRVIGPVSATVSRNGPPGAPILGAAPVGGVTPTYKEDNPRGPIIAGAILAIIVAVTAIYLFGRGVPQPKPPETDHGTYEPDPEPSPPETAPSPGARPSGGPDETLRPPTGDGG